MSHPKGYLGKICHRSKFEVRIVLKVHKFGMKISILGS